MKDAAEIVMPWQQVLEFVQDTNPDLGNRNALIQLRLQLADQFGVSDRMASVQLESLRYEIACVMKGQPSPFHRADFGPGTGTEGNPSLVIGGESAIFVC